MISIQPIIARHWVGSYQPTGWRAGRKVVDGKGYQPIRAEPAVERRLEASLSRRKIQYQATQEELICIWRRGFKEKRWSMDTSSKGKELLDTNDKESANSNAGNTTYILGNEKLVTPQKPEAIVTPNVCRPEVLKSPLNFSTVTVEQLGITPESFVKTTPAKPSSYLKKSRRRSTIGVRGSPETNHLICFIAQQRNLKNTEKSPLAQNSPFQGSPVLYRNVNSLRDRISAFQSAFHPIKENEKIPDCPEFSAAEKEFETTDVIKKEGLSERQQSGFSSKLSSKRRRISYQSNSNENLIDAEKKGIDLPLFKADTHPSADSTCTVEASPANLSEKSSGPGLTRSRCLVEESVQLSDLTEASSGIKVADCIKDKGASAAVSQKTWLENNLTESASLAIVPDFKSPVTSVCKKDIPSSETFVLRSVLKKPSVKLFPESLQKRCGNLCDDGTHPSVISNLGNSCKEQKAENQESYQVPAFVNVKTRKRVTFGEDLSPEVFDESLPANTPLRKGETPARKQDVNSTSPLRLEHSPELLQPNFDDKGENLENIAPLQGPFPVLSPNKSSVSETLSGTDTFSSANNQENMSSCNIGRITRTSNRKNQLTSFAEETVCNLFNAEGQHCKEKKTHRRKSQETKQTNRALPKKKQLLKFPRVAKFLTSIQWGTVIEKFQNRDVFDNVYSKGKLDEVLKPPKNLTKRKTLLPQIPGDLGMNPNFDVCDVSEFCSSYMKTSSLLDNATFDQDSNTNIIDINESENIPKAEYKSGSKKEQKTVAGNENRHISCAPVTKESILSDHPKPDFILQSQEFSAGAQNVGNLDHVFKVSEDRSIKCEKQTDFLEAIEGKPKCSHLMCDSQKDYVSIENIKETEGQHEDLGRRTTEISSEMTCQERKHRRRSMCHPTGPSLHLEQKGNPQNANIVSRSVEMSLENSELCKDLSDAIEQSFQRTSNGTRVRRSTRLQKDLKNSGLVWISLPFPSVSCTSQKTKRRTVCAFENRGLQSLSPRKETVSSPNLSLLSSTSGKENIEDPTAPSHLPGKRRMSFCTSTLANPKNTTQPEYNRRRSFLYQKEKTAL
ncbi:PREDICTED: cell division cycle-associated protein 2 [Chrysochloris asiatica]|uniref:Cell division cycle-associated protein 2 n=1 Tax=Chrysochloris asiatica TaxID=185453 RepID=A0A9B0TI40_CHRAS|nr:PREDICTED: cell division cycle-associated protein 2 [Chrysochloris asiatica]